MGKKILVVDDSVSIRKSVGFVLEQDGFEIVEAVDGLDGLQKAEGNKCDCIVTDINMPNMDGIAFTKELRTIPAYKFVPIIMLTTENQESKMQEGRAAGATGWIVKPFTAEKLSAVIKKVIG